MVHPKATFCRNFVKLFLLLLEQNKNNAEFNKTLNVMLDMIDSYANSPVIEKDPSRMMIIQARDSIKRCLKNELRHETLLAQMTKLFEKSKEYLDSNKENKFFGMF